MNGRRFHGVTMNFANAGIAAGSTTTLTSGAATAGIIGGKFVVPVAAAANIAALSALDANTGLAFRPILPNQASVFIIGQPAAGGVASFRVAQGSIVPTEAGVTTTPGAFINAPQFPELPDDFLPLAYCLVSVPPSTPSFTWGVQAFTTVTTKFVNIGAVPDRPQIV